MTRVNRLVLPALLAAALAGFGPSVLAQGTPPAPPADTAAPEAPPAAGVPEAPAAGPAQSEPAAPADHGAGAGAHHVEIPFFSLYNTNFVVLIAFLVFVAVLLYMKVPGKLGKMLDARAETIRKDLDQARRLREEAQAMLASYERKQAEVKEQADRIVATARAEATAAAAKAQDDLKLAIDRRLKAAEDQIASAEAAAIREVRNRAAEVAVQVAGEVLARQMDASRANALIDEAIDTVKSRLN